LEKKASLKEEALKRSEMMLEQDAIRFDRFLKENDKNAHEAIRRYLSLDLTNYFQFCIHFSFFCVFCLHDLWLNLED
jgi:hypothetical protein